MTDPGRRTGRGQPWGPGHRPGSPRARLAGPRRDRSCHELPRRYEAAEPISRKGSSKSWTTSSRSSCVPVSDVDKAKDFYQGLGWRLDANILGEGDFRVVQLTPPGSACSVIFGAGITAAAPGSAQGMQLTVTDIDAARADLASHGARGQRGVPQRRRRVAPHRRAGTGTRPGPGPPELRLVRLVQRPGRQHVVCPGDHHPPPGPVTRQPNNRIGVTMPTTVESACDLTELPT